MDALQPISHTVASMSLYQHELFTIDLNKVIAIYQNDDDVSVTIRTDDQRKIEVGTESPEAAAEPEQQAQRLASDQGFQDSLSLYQTLPAKQVKTIFMGLEDATVIQYLQAMESRAAAKITREFKTTEESERLKRLLERMRQPQAAVK